MSSSEYSSRESNSNMYCEQIEKEKSTLFFVISLSLSSRLRIGCNLCSFISTIKNITGEKARAVSCATTNELFVFYHFWLTVCSNKRIFSSFLSYTKWNRLQFFLFSLSLSLYSSNYSEYSSPDLSNVRSVLWLIVNALIEQYSTLRSGGVLPHTKYTESV